MRNFDVEFGALATSVAVGLLALTSVALYQQLERARASATALATQLQSRAPSSTSRVEVLRLDRSRAAADEPDLTWPRSGPGTMLEMRLDAGVVPRPPYEVVLARVGSGGDAPILRVPSAGVSHAGDAGGTTVFRLRVTE